MPSNALQFDPATHRYTHAGRELVSVTTVLKLAGLVHTDWYTDTGRMRGTLVHQALEFDDLGELDGATLDALLVPYVQAWRRFRAESGFLVVEVDGVPGVEVRLAHASRGFAGTLDRVGVLNGRLTIVDIKSGAPQPWIALQLAGYAELLRAGGNFLDPVARIQRVGVFVTADGGYKVQTYTDRDDFDVFDAALAVAQWRRRNDTRVGREEALAS